MKNYNYIHDFGVIIITAQKKKDAENTLRELVKNPDAWTFDHSENI